MASAPAGALTAQPAGTEVVPGSPIPGVSPVPPISIPSQPSGIFQDLPAVQVPAPAPPPVLDTTDLRPEKVFDSITARELAAARKLLPPARLEPKEGSQNYELEGDYKMLFQQLATKLGLQVVFDGDYQAGRFLHFRLNDVGPRQALHALEAATSSFVTPLGAKVFIVAQDTEPKRKDLEQVATLSVPIPNALTVQEITELGQAVKQAVGVDKIFWDSQANEIVIKDRVSRVLAAQSILSELVDYRSAVAIDLEFVELDETQMQEFGVDLQTSFPISFLGSLVSGSSTLSGISLSQITKFGVGHMFGVGLVNVNVIAQMTNSGARNLLHATVVSVDGQKATFHSGSKYPVITSQFIGATSGTLGSAPAFTFEDLGIVVTVTPHVHGVDEIGMDLDTEYKLLGGGTVNGIPIIENRKMQSTVNVRDSQWAIVAGLTQDSRSRTFSGPAFFSYIPYLRNLVSHFTGNKSKTYILLAVKPRLLSLPPSQKATRQVYVGSDTRPITPL